MTYKHTQGPWYSSGTVTSDDYTPAHVRIIGPDGVELIASAIYGRTNEERLANARLIEQAPKMLELLTEIFEHIQYGGSLYASSLIFAEDAPAVEVLRATIINAGGELK